MYVNIHTDKSKVGKWKISQQGKLFRIEFVSRVDGQLKNHAGKGLNIGLIDIDKRDGNC
jgi:hypothetical protein